MFFTPPVRTKRFCYFLFAACLGMPIYSRAQQVVHVPSEQPTLQEAISSVPDGGIIELASGTYAAPGGGFTVFGAPKRFTIRAATGTTATLDGGSANNIMLIAPDLSQGSPRTITFERLIFANGRSTSNFTGGAVTLVNTQASFSSCVFQNNVAAGSSTGGGGHWINQSVVSFDGCTWRDNTSPNFGAGMSVLESRVFVNGCRFVNNRINIAGHSANSPGGAIFATQSKLRISTTSFEGNQAAYVGGAIYAIGEWKGQATPSVEVEVSNSSFTANTAIRDSSINAPSLGGAIHVEDEGTLRLFNCRFSNNVAQQGGAISNYRSITEIEGCVFEGNQAIGGADGEAIGGAIIALSSDGPDASTANGTINRRSSQLTVSDSLFRGRNGSAADARQGGSIFVNGDLNAAYGTGVQQNGTIDSNRATVNLTRVIFADSTAAGPGPVLGTGGAFMGALVNFTADHCIFLNSHATDLGGAMELIEGSRALITNTTFSDCEAGSGGALTMFGGELNIDTCNFVRNTATSSGRGAAVTTAPAQATGSQPAFDVVGMIKNTVFTKNSGSTTIYDGDFNTAPFNRLQYANDQFFPDDPHLYIDDFSPFEDVAGLNALVIQRSDGTSTTKSPAANLAPTTAPVVGALVIVPPVIATAGGVGDTLPLPSYIGFVADGGNVTLDGAAQSDNAAIVTTNSDITHRLTVGSSFFSTFPPPKAALNISTRLPVGTDQNVLIGGFIIAPTGGAPKRVLVRAVGPSLNVNGSPVPGTLQDPVLELHDHTGAVIAQNDNWRSTQIGGAIAADQSVEIQSTGAAPTSDAEAAIVATLNPLPDTYTAVVRGANDSTGIALVEVYDLDAVQTSSLANISTRGFVQTGDNVMIGGFIVLGGGGTTNVVVRGLGPSLRASVANSLADPVLELHDAQGNTVDQNDDWAQSPQSAQLQSAGLAPTSTPESAIYRTDLPRGAYTAILHGKDSSTGVGLIEVYIFQ